MKGKERKLIPELRFKGFDGDWRIRHLKEVLTLTTRPLKMEDKQLYSLVTVKRRYEGIVHRGDYKGKDVKVKSQFLLRTNDFLISKRQISHNACGIVPKELNGSIVSNEYSVFLPQKNLDIHYFNYFCRLPKVSKTFFLSSTGVHIEKLIFKVDVWFKYKFAFPPLPEQQKIASFLSSIDEKIQQLTRKKELLEQYKKGVMQQLFLGKVRFKDEDGKDYPKWEENRLGDVCRIKGRIGYRGYTVQDIVKRGEGAITLSPSNIDNGRLDFDDSTYISWSKYNESPEIMVEVNDILLVKTASVGKSAFVSSLKEPATINPQFVVLKQITLYPRYLAYVVYHSTIQKQIRAAVGSGAVPNLSQESISNFLVPTPHNEEQQKIASFLSSLDTKIETVTAQITQTQTFKKGLLQQMFV